MKCKSCGAKVGKTEEICPEFGKTIAESSFKKPDKNDSERDLGKNIRFSDCKTASGRLMTKGIFAGLFFLIGGGILLFRMHNSLKYIFEGYISKFVLFGLIFAFIGIVIIALSIVAGCALRKSFVCINENGVYGIMPRLFLKADWFEFFYDDITDFRCFVPLRGASFILVKADGKQFLLYGLDVNSASATASYIRENIPKKH